MTAAEIVQSYNDAVGRGDFKAARKFLQDDLSFQGPLDTFNRAEDFLAAIQRLAGIVEAVDVKKMFVDGDDVCVLYDMKSKAGTSFIAEWFRIRGGRIASIRVVFDARSFVALQSKASD